MITGLPEEHIWLYLNFQNPSSKQTWQNSLRKIPLFHLIPWYGNCAFPQNFHIRKLGEITVFYIVIIDQNIVTLAISW